MVIMKRLPAAQKDLWFFQSSGLKTGYTEINSLIEKLANNTYGGTYKFTAFPDAMVDVTKYIQEEDKRFEKRVPWLPQQLAIRDAKYAQDMKDIRSQLLVLRGERTFAEVSTTLDQHEAENKHKGRSEAKEPQSPAPLQSSHPPASRAPLYHLASVHPASAASFGSPIHSVSVKSSQHRTTSSSQPSGTPLVDVDLSK